MPHAPKIETDDSRLKGYFVRHDDLAGLGLQQLYCINCGKPNGLIRFDDPDNGRIAVVCNDCLEKLGKPPLQECTRLNKGQLLLEMRWLKRVGCHFPAELIRLVNESKVTREDHLEVDYGNGDGVVVTRFYDRQA